MKTAAGKRRAVFQSHQRQKWLGTDAELAYFCFVRVSRNAVLESSLSDLSYKAPSARKTGTTIAGMVYKVRNTVLNCHVFSVVATALVHRT